MTSKVTGRVKGSYNNTESMETFDLNEVQESGPILSKEVWEICDNKRPLQRKSSAETQKGKDILEMNNVQNPMPDDNPNEPEEDRETEVSSKEIAFFTDPKSVKRKTQRHIFAFQAITAVTVCLIMLLLKLFAPELYNNLHIYYVRLFQW